MITDIGLWLVLALQIFPLIVALRWIGAFILEIYWAPKAEPGSHGEASRERGEPESAEPEFGQPHVARSSRADGDYYQILHVPPCAGPAAIRNAYRHMAFRFHPDRNTSPDAVRRMQAINTAYQVLGDPTQRARYDTQRSTEECEGC